MYLLLVCKYFFVRINETIENLETIKLNQSENVIGSYRSQYK